MEASNANGVPVVIFSQPMAPGAASGAQHPYAAGRKALAKQLTILGSLQIVFGALLILFQIVCVILASTYYHHGFAFIGYGIWIGIFFVITGAFGCAAGRKNNNRGFMITFNVMSIVSAALNTLLVILAALSLVILDFSVYRYGYYYRDHDDQYSAYLERRRRLQRASIALESLMIIMALAEVIVAIYSSVVCCKLGACCCDCGDACCCPPVPVPTQVFWAQQPPPPIDASQQQQQQQQPMLFYSTVAPNPTANDVFHENKHQKPFHYQQLMSDPNIPTDGEIGDHTRLCS